MHAAPVSLPKRVTLEGSPLNFSMLSATQLKAAIWSKSAKLLTTPPLPPPYVFKNPEIKNMILVISFVKVFEEYVPWMFKSFVVCVHQGLANKTCLERPILLSPNRVE